MAEKTVKRAEPRKRSRANALSVLIAGIFLVVACVIFWKANAVFLLAFAGILLAILLQATSTWISHWSKLPYRIVLLGVVLVIGVLLVTFFWVATPLICHQLSQLVEQLPKSFSDFKDSTSSFINWDSVSQESMADEFFFKNEKFFEQASAVFSFTATTIAGFIVFLFLGIYLAYDPDLYFEGAMRLVPAKKEKRAREVLSSLGHTLRWWLVSKFISMAAIGIMSFIGLKILHVPLAFILGLLAALLAFIPYIGSIIASIPAILIALSMSPLKALYVALLYMVIHAIEGYFITPVIEQRTVSLPPALTVLVQILLSLLIGFLGLALASPLTVLGLVLVEELWVRKIKK